jgi:hypothetical protein
VLCGHSETRCKPYEVVREGELVGGGKAYIAGTAVYCGEGESNGWRSHCNQGRRGASRLEHGISGLCACLVGLGG